MDVSASQNDFFFIFWWQISKDMYDEDEEIGYSWIREYHWDFVCDWTSCDAWRYILQYLLLNIQSPTLYATGSR